jgi:hypothetical protein
MVVDTPIVDLKYRSLIRDVSTLAGRLERVKLFSDYLSSQWQSLSSSALAFQWPIVKEMLDHEMVTINQKAF